MTDPSKPSRDAPAGPIPSRDDVVRDVLNVREAAVGGIEYQIRRLRQALANRRGRFALLFAVCNDPARQRTITADVFAALPNLEHIEISFDEKEDSVLAALADAGGAPAPLVVFGLERILPSSERRRERRERTLSELQYRRELFRELERPVVLWMPEYVFTLIGQQAVDFWSWRSGTFFFTEPSESAPASLRHAIPNPIGVAPRLIGREGELQMVVDALAKGRHVALIGPAGVGKTTLAQVAAQRVQQQFVDGIFFVTFPRRTVETDPAASALRDVIRAAVPAATLPAGTAALRSSYLDVLHGRKVLVIADEVPDSQTARILLPPTPAQLLMTSRVSIGLNHPGIEEIHIGMLAVDVAIGMLRESLPSLSAQELTELATLAGGSPLAIKLIAMRLVSDPALTPVQLISNLRNEMRSGSDSSSVGSLVERAYEQLSTPLARTLRLLSVFESDFSPHAAAAICEKPVEVEIGELVQIGVAKRMEGERIALDTLVRDIGRRKLSSEERLHVEFLHSEYFANLIVEADQAHYNAPGSSNAGLRVVQADWPNILQGQAWATANAENDGRAGFLAIKYALGGINLLAPRLGADERDDLFNLAARAASREGRPDLLAPILEELARIQRAAGNDTSADEYDRRALKAYESGLHSAEHPDRRHRLRALLAFGNRKLRNGDAHTASNIFLRVRSTAKEFGLKDVLSEAYLRLANVAIVQGELDRARDLHNQALETLEGTGETVAMSRVLCSLGDLASATGDVDVAEHSYRRALVIEEQTGNIRDAADTHLRLGALGIHTDNLELAQESILQALSQMQRLGDPQGEVRAMTLLAQIALRRRDFDAAERWASQAISVRTPSEAVEPAERARLVLGNVSEARGDHERALESYREVLAQAAASHDEELVDQTLFDGARLLTTMERVEEGVAANLESLLRRAQRTPQDQIVENFGLFIRQRAILGDDRIRGLLSERLSEEDVNSVMEILKSNALAEATEQKEK